MKRESLPVPGGYDGKGSLSSDPGDILNSGRVLPAGFWKGAALSLLLDILATAMSGGLPVRRITEQGQEYNLSQVFISISLGKGGNGTTIASVLDEIISDYHRSVVAEGSPPVRFPGENIRKVRDQNTRLGIPVIKSVWDEVLQCHT